MTRFHGFIGALVVALALVAGGCGGTVIDQQKTEELLEAELPKSLGKKVKSVDCPSGIEVKAGSTFTCTVTVQGGETQTATVKIRDDKADIAVVGLSGGGNGSGRANE